jgi:hypothetical protein
MVVAKVVEPISARAPGTLETDKEMRRVIACVPLQHVALNAAQKTRSFRIGKIKWRVYVNHCFPPALC